MMAKCSGKAGFVGLAGVILVGSLAGQITDRGPVGQHAAANLPPARAAVQVKAETPFRITLNLVPALPALYP